jgi:MerR HTH family regulatory protein
MLAQVDAADGSAHNDAAGAAGKAAVPREYRIGELAREAGIPVRTVRYYQERLDRFDGDLPHPVPRVSPVSDEPYARAGLRAFRDSGGPRSRNVPRSVTASRRRNRASRDSQQVTLQKTAGFQIAGEEFDVRAPGLEQAQLPLLAPAGELAQVQFVRLAGLAAVGGEETR